MPEHRECARSQGRRSHAPRTERRLDRLFLLCALAALIGGGGVYSVYLGSEPTYLDEGEYLRIAENIAAFRGYTLTGEAPTACRPPGYPLLLSIPLFFGGGIFHLRIINYAMLALSALLLRSILREHASVFAARVGLVLFLCYPVLFYTAGTLFPQTFGALLFLAVIRILTRRTLACSGILEAGGCLGLLVLTIPAFVLVVPPLAVWFHQVRGRDAVKRYALVVIVAALPAAIWSVRNLVVFDSLVFVSSNSGINLLLGNSENATCKAGMLTDIDKYRREANLRDLDEIQRDAYYRNEAVKYILAHKLRTAALYCGKWLNHFHYRNDLWTARAKAEWRNALMLMTYGPLLLLFVSRLLFLRHIKPSSLEVLLIGLYLSSAFFYAVFFTRIRFRLPFDYLLIMVLAVYAHRALDRRRGCLSSGGER